MTVGHKMSGDRERSQKRQEGWELKVRRTAVEAWFGDWLEKLRMDTWTRVLGHTIDSEGLARKPWSVRGEETERMQGQKNESEGDYFKQECWKQTQ